MTDFKNNNTLHQGAKSRIFTHAKALRNSMTEAENVLWNQLRNSRLNGYKFRRQHPIKRFIADFYCHEAKLVIEIDGEIHHEPRNKEHDDGRTYELQESDIRVIRFTNQEILNSMSMVLNNIHIAIQQSLSLHK